MRGERVQENGMSEQHESSTIANVDLWSRYFQNEWGRWAPQASPMAELAEGTAARVASFLTLVAAGPIAWLYAANEPRPAKISGEPARVEHPRDEDLELEMVLAGSAA
jgi:hypothetical protein